MSNISKNQCLTCKSSMYKPRYFMSKSNRACKNYYYCPVCEKMYYIKELDRKEIVLFL